MKSNLIFLTAVCGIPASLSSLPAQPADTPDKGFLLGVTAVEEPLPWFDAGLNYPAFDKDLGEKRDNRVTAVTSLGRPPMEVPVSLVLSRSTYPAEDLALDAVVRLDLDLGSAVGGTLEVRLLNKEGQVIEESILDPIPGTQLFFSCRFPESIAGQEGELRIRWNRPGVDAAEASASFRIAEPAQVAKSGRIALRFPNETRASARGIPVTVGVPFPQGALADTDNLRLVDEAGREIPLQATPVATWSRFGFIKWVHCAFTIDLTGQAREVFLEYGPKISRVPGSPLAQSARLAGEAIPEIDAGRLRVNAEGIFYDVKGEGYFQKLFGAEALRGGFVRKVDGLNPVGWGHRFMMDDGEAYGMPPSSYVLEENGPEKAVLRVEDWYQQSGGDVFCKFVTRLTFFRDSPIIRIFHTWIFTGDGNRDVIRAMGWKFPLDGLKPAGFLDSFSTTSLQPAFYLRQEDENRFAVFDYESPPWKNLGPQTPIATSPLKELSSGTRAPGVMAAENETMRVYVGVKDFWENFPRALEQTADSMTFYEWPRYGRPAQHTASADSMGDIWRLWFVHEGEILSFTLPRELVQGPIYAAEAGPEPHMTYGRTDSVNAQGIAKTAEFWLYLTETSEPVEAAAKVLRGLDEDALRAVVDPVWMTDSGVFYEIAPQDKTKYPELEAAYEAMTGSARRQIERMGVYGKWIYGDLLRAPDLTDQTASLYRTFRKAHWGWPMSWVPYVRSGDLARLRDADAATRMMTDVGYCHYVSDDVAAQFAALPKRWMWSPKRVFRKPGWQNRNLVPWAGYWGPTTRSYADKADYLWDAWYITGYQRARDVALAWAEQTKLEEPFTIDGELHGRGPITAAWNRGRWSALLQKQYLEMYQAIWDPWFLCAAQALQEMNDWRRENENVFPHMWSTGAREYARFTGDPKAKELYVDFARKQQDWHNLGWAVPSNMIPAAAYGYHLTGDRMLLRQLAGLADLARWSTADEGFPEYYKGFFAAGESNTHMLQSSWFQTYLPLALAAFNQAGEVPQPLPLSFDQNVSGAKIAVRKAKGQPLTLRPGGQYAITGPEGTLFREGEDAEIELPADAPEGIYEISLGDRSVRLPLSPPDTPEVMVLSDNRKIAPGGGVGGFPQHWFLVPEGVESFQITFQDSPFARQDLRLLSIWDADGKRVWTHHQLAGQKNDPDKPIVAEVTVDPKQAGRLWRVTLPGTAPAFQLDPQIPPMLSHDPVRWFDPKKSTTDGH